jgi:hypothetical protein
MQEVFKEHLVLKVSDAQHLAEQMASLLQPEQVVMVEQDKHAVVPAHLQLLAAAAAAVDSSAVVVLVVVLRVLQVVLETLKVLAAAAAAVQVTLAVFSMELLIRVFG